jgi:elongation factor P
MKVPVNSIRAGNVIEYNGKLWVAAKVQHISPGKGGAFVAIEAKALREGNKLQERFRSGETIEHVHIDERECTYLFKDDNGFTFMDKENYEQLTLPRELIEGQVEYLLPNTPVIVNFHNERPMGLQLPPSVVLTITETEPNLKGATATGSFKPAKTETGLTVQVPAFVGEGEKIKVNTDSGEYIERM